MLKAMKSGWLVMVCAVTAAANTRFQARPMTRNDVPAGKGQCDIRLQVDGEVEVSVRGDRVDVRTLSGRDARDDGSECNAPMPKSDVRGFRFEVLDKRDDVRLVAEPGARNGWAAIVHIRDSSGGEGRYHFRLSWATKSYDFDRPPAGAGFSWNNTLSFKGNGRGQAVTNEREDVALRQATMEIDHSGKLAIWFRTERGGQMSFSGQVLAREGDRWKADVMSEDRRLRGSMWITVGGKQQVENVSLEATDGRDRLRLSWNRR